MRFISKWIAATVTWIATSLANQPVTLATMMAGHIPPANPDPKLKPSALIWNYLQTLTDFGQGSLLQFYFTP